jgi:hypothetical protein
MSANTNVYVCSKPLQYFNIRNLPKDDRLKCVLIVEDKFKDAYIFYKKVNEFDKDWNEVVFIDNRSKIFWLCLFKYKVVNFYYYLDFMLKASILLYILPCKKIYVYEEGISAYRTEIFAKTANYKRKIRKFFGLSEYAGLHPKTEGIYVYNKEKYLNTFSFSKKKLNPLPFQLPFQEMIKNNLSLALKIFQFKTNEIFSGIINKKVLFYITSWPINESALQQITVVNYDYIVIKPHPHIRKINLPDTWKNAKTIVVESVILAEFLVEILKERNNVIDIYHHNSSAAMYLQTDKNINSINNF